MWYQQHKFEFFGVSSLFPWTLIRKNDNSLSFTARISFLFLFSSLEAVPPQQLCKNAAALVQRPGKSVTTYASLYNPLIFWMSNMQLSKLAEHRNDIGRETKMNAYEKVVNMSSKSHFLTHDTHDRSSNTRKPRSKARANIYGWFVDLDPHWVKAQKSDGNKFSGILPPFCLQNVRTWWIQTWRLQE